MPIKRLSPMFLFGFFTSPAMNVILFHASLLKIEPTIEAAIAPSIALPATPPIIFPVPSLEVICHASVQFADQVSPFAVSNNPNIMRAKSDSNLVTVKVVCIIFPPFIPFVFI